MISNGIEKARHNPHNVFFSQSTVAIMSGRCRWGVWVLAVLLGACETVVEVPLPEHEAQVVAQSFFAPDSLWKVQVSNTVSFTSLAEPVGVVDATVEIWEGERLVERLPHRGAGTYASAARTPERGKQYTLRVSAPGHADAEGQARLPEPPQVVAFKQYPIEIDTLIGLHVTRFEIELADPPGEDNFYGLQLRQQIEIINYNASEVTTTPWRRSSFASKDPVFNDSDVFDPEIRFYQDALFNDDFFAGRTYTLEFEIRYTDRGTDPNIEVNRSFQIFFQSVSEDYFRYWKTAELQDQVGENPFAEPVQVHSNMTNGFGIFAGYRFEAWAYSAGS